MLNFAIPIPNTPGKQDIEIEMSMNGQKQKLRYRVEVFRWENCPVQQEDRVDCIKDVLKDYDQEDWVIYHIGAPTNQYVPLTFIKKEDWVAQHKWLRGSISTS